MILHHKKRCMQNRANDEWLKWWRVMEAQTLMAHHIHIYANHEDNK